LFSESRFQFRQTPTLFHPIELYNACHISMHIYNKKFTAILS